MVIQCTVHHDLRLIIFNYREDKDMTPRDLELLGQLEALVKAAKEESERYRGEYGFGTMTQAYINYRSHCFMLVYKYFKTIADEMDYEPSNYHQGLTMGENMESFILACRAEQEGGWVNNVLKQIGRVP